MQEGKKRSRWKEESRRKRKGNKRAGLPRRDIRDRERTGRVRAGAEMDGEDEVRGGVLNGRLKDVWLSKKKDRWGKKGQSGEDREDVRWCNTWGRGQDERTKIERSAREGKKGAEELEGNRRQKWKDNENVRWCRNGWRRRGKKWSTEWKLNGCQQENQRKEEGRRIGVGGCSIMQERKKRTRGTERDRREC